MGAAKPVIKYTIAYGTCGTDYENNERLTFPHKCDISADLDRGMNWVFTNSINEFATLRYTNRIKDADWIFSSVLGHPRYVYPHETENKFTVCIVGEAVNLPDRKICPFDLAISFNPDSGHNIWAPVYAVQEPIYSGIINLDKQRREGTYNPTIHEKFCCTVVSNNDPNCRISNPSIGVYKNLKRIITGDRHHIFEVLSNRISKVDSGGQAFNNIGGPVVDKGEFLRNYRFNICYENCISSGYCTEKLFQAYLNDCIPIYNGDPNLLDYINPKSLIYTKGLSDDEVVERVKTIENNPDLYEQMIKEPIFNDPEFLPKLNRSIVKRIMMYPKRKIHI